MAPTSRAPQAVALHAGLGAGLFPKTLLIVDTGAADTEAIALHGVSMDARGVLQLLGAFVQLVKPWHRASYKVQFVSLTC